jgi:hypothetical protein
MYDAIVIGARCADFRGAVAGIVPIPELFSPENIGQIIGAAEIAQEVMSA